MTKKYLAISSAILLSVSALLQTSAEITVLTPPLQPAGNQESPINVEPRDYTDAEGALLKGFLSLPSDGKLEGKNRSHSEQGFPAVVILHDISGPDDYEKQRATILSHDYGYVGLAADIFGEDGPPPGGDWASNRPYASAFTENATLFTQRIQAAVEYVQSLEEVDATKVGISGYCMGGIGVVHYLNTMGKVDVPLAGAVSIHPSLTDGPGPTAEIDVPSLFLTGGADFLTGPKAMATLENDMKRGTSGNASSTNSPSWETVRYSGIGHAFSNWWSEMGYDARTDARSWHSMMTFLENEFTTASTAVDGSTADIITPPEARVEQVNYTVGEHLMKGYVAKPKSMMAGSSGDLVLSGNDLLRPVVISFPHKMDADTGPDMYERQRATQLADSTGYIAFVADIYSSMLSDDEDEFVVDLEAALYNDTLKFVQIVQGAVDYAKGMEGVDPTKIALVGFGFGGSGVLLYGISDQVDESVKAVMSFHGEMDQVVNATEFLAVSAAPVESASGGGGWGGPSRELEDGNSSNNNNKPYILIQSGTDGDNMEDVMKVEELLIILQANYELTRFSNAMGAWSVWGEDEYDAHATARSSDQLQTVLVEAFDGIGGGSITQPTTMIEDDIVTQPTTTTIEGGIGGNATQPTITTVGGIGDNATKPTTTTVEGDIGGNATQPTTTMVEGDIGGSATQATETIEDPPAEDPVATKSAATSIVTKHALAMMGATLLLMCTLLC